MMGSANVLLIIFFTYLYFDSAACLDSRCRETEWKALMDFKGSLFFKGIPGFNGSLVSEFDQLSSWKGRDCCSWRGNLKYAKFISLSGNHLHGVIPDELMVLTELQSLNLSNNELTGKIPERIGNMKHLESLDLSMNQLSGTIPQSLVNIDVLSYLKLSFNNLSGRIPSGGHFDTLNGLLVYEGNGELCGKPTTKSCDGEDLVPSKQSGVAVSDDDSEFEILWIYAGIGPGFAVGFLGVFCLLFFKSSWRYRYFRFLENVYNRF